MTQKTHPHRILILGGGFGGVSAALKLKKWAASQTVKVTLLTDKTYLEYPAALYRVVTGRSPMEACVSYRDIFTSMDIDVAIDRATGVDLQQKIVRGESGFAYHYDSLIVAVGSQTAYFGVPGIQELSHGMKSATQALELKSHLHSMLENTKNETDQKKNSAGHIVIVGGGASGVELAGELAMYAKSMAVAHGLSPSIITIHLVEAMLRLLPLLPESASKRALVRLQSLGVDVMLGQTVLKEETNSIVLQDKEIQTQTVIWTAGLKGNALLAAIQGLQVDKRGRVEVDDTLQAKGNPDVYVIGDAAATKYSGMAQTAVRDGNYVATVIVKKLQGKHVAPSRPMLPIYAVPVGPGWAIVVFRLFSVWGRLGWWLRRAADMKVFLLLLPPFKAIRAYVSGEIAVESCPVCRKN